MASVNVSVLTGVATLILAGAAVIWVSYSDKKAEEKKQKKAEKVAKKLKKAKAKSEDYKKLTDIINKVSLGNDLLDISSRSKAKNTLEEIRHFVSDAKTAEEFEEKLKSLMGIIHTLENAQSKEFAEAAVSAICEMQKKYENEQKAAKKEKKKEANKKQKAEERKETFKSIERIITYVGKMISQFTGYGASLWR